MSDSYPVRNVRVRQAPQLNSSGDVVNFTLVTFSVGPHGPFTIMFPPGTATAQAVTDAIKATVNQLREQDQIISAFNAGA